MTKTEYKNEIAELRARLDKLSNEEIEEDELVPPHPKPYPECGDFYYYVNPMSEVDETNWASGRFDLGAREIGNVFVTENAAEIAAERLKVLAEMREWAGKWNDPYAIAYVEVVTGETRIIVNDKIKNLSHGEMRFATLADAQNCIKAVGEDKIIKYYFGVPDDDE